MDKELLKLLELNKALDKLMDAIDPEPLIKVEIMYKPVMLGVKHGINKELAELFEKDYGITKQQIDDLIEKHLNQSSKNLTLELSELIIKGIKRKYPDAEIRKTIIKKEIVEGKE